MINGEAIVAGDMVDLTRRQNEVYKTMIGDIDADGALLAVVPSQRGAPVPVSVGEKFRLYYYRQSGRYCIDVSVDGFTMSGAVRLIRLLPASEPRQEQRREFYRLPASLRTLVCQYTEEEELVPESTGEQDDEIAYTNDISVSGVSLKTRQEHAVGERMLLRVYLNWPTGEAPPLDIYSEVRRVSPMPEADGYQVGVLFLQLDGEDDETIREFVIAQQQKRVRLQRLIDGD